MMQAPPHRSEALGRELGRLFGHRLSENEADRQVYSRDMWPRALLALQDDMPVISPPDFVVWPETTEELVELTKLALRFEVPLVPYGAGSGVCGGAQATNGGIIVDLKRMNRLLWTSSEDHLARFEVGIIGQTLEDELNLRGLTLGHFPSSIYCSTLGGWLAARSAGQMSSRYGKIEDMVEQMEVVLPDGQVLELHAGRLPDLCSLFVGSEGTLAIISKATMRVHPLADHRIFRAYEFPRIAAGCEGIRRVMQGGVRPAVVRLYDEMDTLMARPSAGDRGSRRSLLDAAGQLLSGQTSRRDLKPVLLRAALSRAAMLSKLAESLVPRLRGGCLMILGFEGDPEIVATEMALAHAEIEAAGGIDLGEGPGIKWYEHRYAVSYKMSPVFAAGGFVDTMEVASTWDRLLTLYEEVRAALASSALVLAHFSHAYSEGCSIYFTFAAAADSRARAEAAYDQLWRRGLAAAVRAGGTISHHHGVGLSKATFMAKEHGESMSVYRQAKTLLDPHNILNPGKMGL